VKEEPKAEEPIKEEIKAAEPEPAKDEVKAAEPEPIKEDIKPAAEAT